MRLTPEQHAAVREPGNLSLVACPGSGKTRTVVAKILSTIEDVRDTCRRVGAITYTNAAVDEIVERLHTHGASDDHSYYEVSTIHSFCLTHILSPFHERISCLANGFRLMTAEDDEWKVLAKEIVTTHALKDSAVDLFDQIHRCPGGEIVAPRGVSQDAASHFVAAFEKNGWASFSDVVFHSACLVSMHSFIASALASRFRWLIVDEFQDTSDTQVVILEAIAKENRTGFMFVGDPNQSIMSFAGARLDLMPELSNRIGARCDLKLTGNHRSSASIITHAERLCATSPAMLAVGPSATCAASPEYYVSASVAAGITQVFLPRIQECGIRLGDAAVFAPWWLPLYHLAQTVRGTGVRVIGPGARPYKRRHEVAHFSECLSSYLAAPSGDRFQKLQRSLFLTVLGLSKDLAWSVYTYEGRTLIFRLIGVGKESAHATLTVGEWLPTIAAAAAKELESGGFIGPDGAEALTESARRMLDEMKSHGVDPGTATLDELGMYATPEDSLQLMTMHAAKGKEFEAVALVDLHEGRLPHWTAQTQAEIDEARRLLYVGVTRAKKVLMYFTDYSHPKNRPTHLLGPSALNLL